MKYSKNKNKNRIISMIVPINQILQELKSKSNYLYDCSN